MNKTLKIYIPVPGSRIDKVLARGSGIVGAEHPNGILLHFEGNLFRASNLVRYEDRLKHAAGRLVSQYPTRAMMVLTADEVAASLIEAGEYDPETWTARLAPAHLDAVRNYSGEEG